ncbi:MAG: hypothetical protein Q9226_002914 [Calogaya cf. arnoldii]
MGTSPGLAIAGNLTNLLTSIPSDFSVELQFELPVPYLEEACFVNLIAGLHAAANGDFTGNMPIGTYRTTRFASPLLKINTPSQVDIPRKYVAWGLFLTASFFHAHEEFHLAFFGLRWQGEAVGGIGIGGPLSIGKITSSLTTSPSNYNFKISHAYFGAQVIRKGSVFITIASAFLEAAPPPLGTRIQTTWINYVNNEPCAFILTPSEAARTTAGPFFMNKDLIDVLAKATDYFAGENVYRQMELNISVAGVMVAQAAFVHRSNPAFLKLAPDYGNGYEGKVAWS